MNNKNKNNAGTNTVNKIELDLILVIRVVS